MLRHFLITLAMLLVPYLAYAVFWWIRRKLERPQVVNDSFWSRVPVFALGLIGCVLAVTVLIAVAILDTNPDNPRYVPPIVQESE